LSWSPHHRHLHPFPTRRSSDLSSIANPTVEGLTSPKIRERAHHIVGMGAEVAADHDLPLWMEETGPTSCPGTNDTSRTHAQALRSEEHTSELQSRFDLVCRLLL